MRGVGLAGGPRHKQSGLYVGVVMDNGHNGLFTIQ